MTQDRFARMLELLKSKITSRLRGPTSNHARGAEASDEIGGLAPTDGRGAALDLANEHDSAATRAAFSQHISSWRRCFVAKD